MKKFILAFTAFLLLGLNIIAQNNYNIVIFSEDHDGFFAFVNGIRQNDKPETNVKITGLNSEALNVRIEFNDKALPKLKQNMMPESGFEHTIRIKKNLKKELKMQYFGKVALADAPKSGASTVAYHISENPSTLNTSNNNTTNDNGETTFSTTSATTQVNSNSVNNSFNVNDGGAGVNINMNGMDGNGGSTKSTTSTTVTTTSSSSSSGNTQTTISNASTKPVGNAGCISAMNNGNYEKMKQSVDSKPFAETKMSTAKVVTKNACLSANQIKGICALFSMDDDKLTYAKYAYNYCLDKANYYQVSEIFSFSATTVELNKFLEQN